MSTTAYKVNCILRKEIYHDLVNVVIEAERRRNYFPSSFATQIIRRLEYTTEHIKKCVPIHFFEIHRYKN